MEWKQIFGMLSAGLLIGAMPLLLTLPAVIEKPGTRGTFKPATMADERDMLRRINALIREIQRTQFSGTGKPERLRHALVGYWSRRITAEHRIVYHATEDTVYIAQLRYHY
jgi:toxin YoeB